jgi:hypothetical protein
VRALAVAQLHALLDQRATVRLIAAFGGQTLHLAKRADDLRYQQTGATLNRVIGPDAAEALRREFAGQDVRLPLPGGDFSERDVQIELLLRQGRSVEEVCRIAVFVVHPTAADVRRVAREAGIPIAPHRARKAPASGNENHSQVRVSNG